MPTAERYHQYEILRRDDGSLWELGRGSMGITYKAYDTNLRFTVALKVINSAYLESDTARQRFLREARAAAALRHSNVASVFNLGIEQDKYFYVMEFIDGETVEACVKRKGSLEPVESLNIALQVARALAVAAKQQLVHRDLKPTNLMLVDQEGESIVKVIDFGLAKVAKDAGEDSGTLTMGGFVGTPHFASPEQVEEGEVDIRSDIYSLGATLYFVLTGQSPFSGSVGQVMSQHLYKPLPMERLTSLPRCVVSLLQRMMEKDRNSRPQTPQELQKAILACLEEIRPSSGRSVHKNGETTSAFETLALSSASGQPFSVGVVLAQNYRLIEELVELPQGRKFLADDLRRKRRVSLLVLSPEFLSDATRLASLEEAVQLVRNAPHPMLREIYSLETVTDCTFLVEEHVVGLSLLDVLRARSVLSGPEVVRLLNLLAPLADYASSHRLQHIDLTLVGIHLACRAPPGSGVQSDLLVRPLTAWEPLEAKVDAIDFSFMPSDTATWAGSATRIEGAAHGGPRGSCLRLLSLLAYELLGGPRTRVESTGQYTPIAALTQEGNAALRRALVDECPSARELAGQLAAAVAVKGPAASASASAKPFTPQPLPRTLPPKTSVPIKPKSKVSAWVWVLAIGVIASLGIVGSFTIYRSLHPPTVPQVAWGNLAVESDPTGAAITLDEGAPIKAPYTFNNLKFGSHRLTANLKGYQPIQQDLRFEATTPSKIILKLQQSPPQEIVALSVQSEPAGAVILLDGKPPQAPSNTFTHVPFGRHQLSATLDDYEPIKQDFEVRRGMTPQIRLQLKPTQEIASLSVQTEPAGAAILLDGEPPQAPSNTFTHVPFGAHQLTATLDDYEPIKQDIEVRRGMTPKIRLQLKPTQEIAALSVQSEPAGAVILLDGKPPQAPANTFTHVPFGTHQLTATLDEYEPIKQNIEVRRGMAPKLRLQLKPTQEIASLSVQSEPAGAAILLDGEPPKAPSNTFTHVPFGTHQLTATLDDYEPIKQDIEVRRGMTPKIRLQLKPTQEIASLSVQTEPAGAAILLDGKPPQAPSNTFTRVPFGTHQLTATLDDYEPITQDIEVRRGMTPQIRLQLKPTQEIASLSVQSEPAGAAILLDGKPPQAPSNTFTHVPFGRHQLSATLDDYEPIKQDFEVRRGMTPQIRLQLKPTQEIASLSVQSEPAGAAILLDGKPPQAPANTFTHVPFGRHQLSATLDDYEPIKQDFEVRGGMTPQIRLQLKPTQEIAALSVQSEPTGAAILLDGKPPQAPANTFTHVPFGTHQLSANLDDYEPIKQDFEVRRGMTPQIRLQLKPTQEIAALSVQTEPVGAAILLDGKPPQAPSNTFTHVPFGTHQLSASLDDYEPIKQDFEIRRGMTPQIRLQLKPTQEIAALSVQTEPVGAAILLDGKPPQAPSNTFTHVPFGTHQVSATLENYEPITQDIEIRRGMSPDIHLQLRQIQEIAALSVQTVPSGAAILLDGKPPQAPQNTFTHVPFGSHQLSATLENYEPIKQDIDVRAGIPAEIQLQLSPIQETGRRAFQTLLRDAQLGDSNAMMKLGRLYLKKGTPNDDAEGFNWLNRAYDAPNRNLEAGAYIGDCYLSGRGTKQDVQKAEEIIMPLANQNVVPAKTLAGRILVYKAELKRTEAAGSENPKIQKQLVAQANELDRQARQWWERAEKDDWNAAAHLGKFYEEGWGGVEKSEEQAEIRYKGGVNHGNALSMLFYGLMIEKKPARRSEAETLISRAATAGLPSAIKWCKDNNVTFGEKRPNDDRL